MAPTSRKGPAQTKRIFDNRRYFVIPKGKGDATCRNCGDAVPRPNYNTSSMHKHLEIHHPPLWTEAERNAEAAGKASDKDKEESNGGAKKPAKDKPKRRVIIEDSDDDEPPTIAATAPAQPVENPQMGRRGTLEGDWPVERIEAMRVAQNGQVFWWVKWQGFPDEQSTWEPTEHLENAHGRIDAYLRTTWRRFLPLVPSFQLQ
ncbi:Chromo domain containing protein [Aphelenchoides avenae]|nr:Chromo domain containing protein [Aphelenchus avenae]